MNNDDIDIIAGFKLNDKKDIAFHILVKKYKEKLYWHIRRIVLDHNDADDVLQNTFVKIWRNIDSFREESSLYTWIYRIATNESISFINSKKRMKYISINNSHNSLEKKITMEPYFEGDKIQTKLQEAILKLPKKQMIVFNMRYFDEIKYEDMSKILNTSVGALKASYFHAVKKIEEYLNNTHY
ncbi:MAG: RNA polymerase sigma factor [Bacteroidales bacterium]|jgi:RNA polymerase sigma-70 factor (ECF subfamily)|nr:RNA polymerase sigma factor [Bacteroidales bacterium]